VSQKTKANEPRSSGRAAANPVEHTPLQLPQLSLKLEGLLDLNGHMLAPVMSGLGDRCDHILDLAFLCTMRRTQACWMYDFATRFFALGDDKTNEKG
jgi:hypothetical protein